MTVPFKPFMACPEAAQDKGATPYDQCVLLFIWRHRDKPSLSYKDFAEGCYDESAGKRIGPCGASETTVKKSIKAMLGNGWIKRKDMSEQSPGETAYKYTIIIGTPEWYAAQASHDTGGGARRQGGLAPHAKVNSAKHAKTNAEARASEREKKKDKREKRQNHNSGPSHPTYSQKVTIRPDAPKARPHAPEFDAVDRLAVVFGEHYQRKYRAAYGEALHAQRTKLQAVLENVGGDVELATKCIEAVFALDWVTNNHLGFLANKANVSKHLIPAVNAPSESTNGYRFEWQPGRQAIGVNHDPTEMKR